MCWFFGGEVCGIVAPRPGIEPTPSAFEAEVSTTGPTRKSRFVAILKLGGFPGGAVVENLPANAGDMGSSPGLGRSHMPRSN